MYRTKEYSERSIEEIDREIELMASYYPDTKRIFLADGDALNLETTKLTHILLKIQKEFDNLERISSYSMPKNLLEKSTDELESLKKAGLDMVYLGIESGNNTVLKKVTKGATSKMIVDSCKKAKDAGFVLSCMVILGLGGKNYSKVHAKDTSKIINEIEPNYIGALTLYMEPAIEHEFYTKFKEPFIPLDDLGVLDELNELITGIGVTGNMIFRANHASNVYSIGGTLPKDKPDILQKIDYLKEHPELLKPKMLRRF
jgi:radical SAM superfamily enzyme YgiQ (UPF0313 family)